MPTYHGGDELTYHLPTIVQFHDQLPGVDLVDYPAAQTPLYHLLVALWGQLVGMELWRLRIVGVVASYAAVLVLYRLLRRHGALDAWPAAGLALVFALSPYVFGQSFILGTDNLGLLFCLLAIERFLAFSRDGLRLAPFALACLWLSLALLTRQSYVWLGLFGGVWLLTPARDRPPPGRAGDRACWRSPAALFAALVIAWKGIVPVGGDPASCGLCAPEEGRLGWRDASPLRSPLFTLAVLAVYGPLLFWRPAWDGLRGADRETRRSWAADGADRARDRTGRAAGRAALLRQGRRGLPVARLAQRSAAARHLVAVLAAGADRLRRRRARRCGASTGARCRSLLFVAFIAAQLATRLPYQKYFDPFVLLVCLLALRRSRPALVARRARPGRDRRAVAAVRRRLRRRADPRRVLAAAAQAAPAIAPPSATTKARNASTAGARQRPASQARPSWRAAPLSATCRCGVAGARLLGAAGVRRRQQADAEAGLDEAAQRRRCRRPRRRSAA